MAGRTIGFFLRARSSRGWRRLNKRARNARNSYLAALYIDEEAAALGDNFSFGVENPCGSPVLAAFAADDAAFQSNGRAGRDRAQVVDLHFAGHGHNAMGADGFTHTLIEQCGDDAAMRIAGRPFKCVGDGGVANDGTVFGEQEIEMQADGIGNTATEAAVLCRMSERGKV